MFTNEIMFEGSKISRPLPNSTLRVCEVREKVVDKTRTTKDNNLPSPTILMIVQKEEKMFKVGIITDQVSMDFEYALKIINGLGVKYIEIHSLWNKTIENLTVDEAARAQKLIEKYSLQVSNISSTLFLMCHLQESETELESFDDHFITKSGDYREHMRALEYCIKLCEIFATDKIRIFGFRKKKSLNDDTVVKMVIQRLQQPVELAEKTGITLILENCPHTYLGSGSLTRRVIDEGNSKNLKALWDPGNALRTGIIPYPDDYKKIREYILHIHAKDLVPENSDYQPVSLGEGETNYQGIIKNLVEDNYEEIISLEPEYEDKTGGRVESSRQCLAGIRKILSSLGIQLESYYE